MFVWIGALFPDEVALKIRKECDKNNRILGLNNVAFQLPQHISLKITFEVEDEFGKKIINRLVTWLKSIHPIKVFTEEIQIRDNVLWIRMKETEELDILHKNIDNLLKKEFDIPQHIFDRRFVFHSTLYLDDNIDKLNQMYQMVKDYPLPKEIIINRFAIGSSSVCVNGQGDFKINRIIEVK